MTKTLKELEAEILKKFEKEGDRANRQWGFIDKAPCLFTDETKQYIKRYFVLRYEEDRVFLSATIQRVAESVKEAMLPEKKETDKRALIQMKKYTHYTEVDKDKDFNRGFNQAREEMIENYNKLKI